LSKEVHASQGSSPVEQRITSVCKNKGKPEASGTVGIVGDWGGPKGFQFSGYFEGAVKKDTVSAQASITQSIDGTGTVSISATKSPGASPH
jgi:hypothetical protein